MFFPSTPKILKNFIFKKAIWEINTSNKELFLSFDDGPIPEVTPLVLDILDEYNAKATFFMVGRNVMKYPNIYKKVIQKGHKIGNHTFNHLNGWKNSFEDYMKDVKLANDLLNTNYFRPPFGKLTKKKVDSINEKFKIIMWSVISGDFNKNFSNEKCTDNVIKYAKKGSIILFHDSLKAKEKMLFSLKNVLEHFNSKGYLFKKIEL